MPLVNAPFEDSFIFSRARAAPYRDATGAQATAPVDQPRFDHGVDGAPRGLLIEGRPEFGQADRLRTVAGDWAVPGGTVLHCWEDEAGVEQRRAWYAPADPKATLDGCLNLKGRMREIAYVPTYLPNRGGYVLWRKSIWSLGAVLAVEDGVALGVTSTIMMLEG